MSAHTAYQKARAWWPEHIVFAAVIAEGKTYKVGFERRNGGGRTFYGTSFEDCFAMAGAQ